MLLDTNVLSELMRPQPDKKVLAWFATQRDAHFYISAINQAEILLGIVLMPGGKRRNNLATAAEAMFREDFAGRCLPFDAAAAKEYALLVAERSQAGAPITTEDAQIAAIALCHGLSLVTRNEKDFNGIVGLVLINPWR